VAILLAALGGGYKRGGLGILREALPINTLDEYYWLRDAFGPPAKGEVRSLTDKDRQNLERIYRENGVMRPGPDL